MIDWLSPEEWTAVRLSLKVALVAKLKALAAASIFATFLNAIIVTGVQRRLPKRE